MQIPWLEWHQGLPSTDPATLAPHLRTALYSHRMSASYMYANLPPNLPHDGVEACKLALLLWSIVLKWHQGLPIKDLQLTKERKKIISTFMIVSDKLKTLPSFSLIDLVRCSTLASPHVGLPLPLQDQRMLSFWTSSNHIHGSSELQLAQLPRVSCPLGPAWLVQGSLEWLLECEFDSWILLLMSSCVPIPVSTTFQKWSHGEGLEICAVSKSTQSLRCWSIYL